MLRLDGRVVKRREFGHLVADGHGRVVCHHDGPGLVDLARGRLGNLDVVVIQVVARVGRIRGVNGDGLVLARGSGVERSRKAGDQDAVALHQVALVHVSEHRRVGRAIVLLVLCANHCGDRLLGDSDLHIGGGRHEGVGTLRRRDHVGLAVRRNRLDHEVAASVYAYVVLAARLDGIGDQAAAFRGPGHVGDNRLFLVAVGDLHRLGSDGLRPLRVDRHDDGPELLLVCVVFRDGNLHGHLARIVAAVGGPENAAVQLAAARVVADDLVSDSALRIVRLDVAREVDVGTAIHGRDSRNRRRVVRLGDSGRRGHERGRHVIVVVIALHAIEHGVCASIGGLRHILGPTQLLE